MRNENCELYGSHTGRVFGGSGRLGNLFYPTVSYRNESKLGTRIVAVEYLREYLTLSRQVTDVSLEKQFQCSRAEK